MPYIAKLPAFAGVRVQARDRDPRRFDPEPVTQSLSQQIDGLKDLADRKRVLQFKKRFVRAGQCDP